MEHNSYLDPGVIAWGPYRRLGRPVRFLAKEGLFDAPGLGWILRSSGQIPVARASPAGRREGSSCRDEAAPRHVVLRADRERGADRPKSNEARSRRCRYGITSGIHAPRRHRDETGMRHRS
ncbi:MAG: 1-acyl-sn-glycerol-3-phosphate acyltransferase [Actinomycetota bacterium]|nr:1-acyl-sn-glycerol-3-phosphate acyltransferase [Actinomycetota bacterium]